MTTDPNVLLAASRCFRCIPKGRLNSVAITLLIDWANGGVVPPGPHVSWTPASAVASWDDIFGSHTGDLATFLATADTATVTALTLSDVGLTDLDGLNTLPQLGTLDVSINPGLTILDLTGCSLLSILYCSSCGLTSLVLTGCVNLTFINCAQNSLTTLDVSAATALLSLDANFNALISLDLSGLALLQVVDVSQNSLTSCNLTGTLSLAVANFNANLLNQANVDSILCALVANAVAGGTVTLTNNTQPGAAGAACMATLLSTFWTVNVDTHATATIWAAAVVTNGGGAPSANTTKALSDFMYAIDGAGVTPKMLAVNCMAPDDLVACATPLIKVKGSDPWGVNVFSEGDQSTDGLSAAGGGGAYLNTGVNPTTAVPDDESFGLTLYMKTDASLPICRIGCTDGVSKEGTMYSDGATFYYGIWGIWSYTFGMGSGTAGEYFFCCMNRTPTNIAGTYKANANVGFQTISAGGIGGGIVRPNLAIFMGAINQNGTPVAAPASNCAYSFAALHYGLDATEAQALFNAVQAMRTAIGGGYT